MTLQLRIFNTRTRKVEEFKELKKGQVGLYTCGPTVYSYAHIGNMRSYIFADLLRRSLQYAGYKVNHVMNITDVGHLTDDADDGEDKLEVGAKREGLDAWGCAKKYTDAFFDHAEKLNILRPIIVCNATDHIQDQIDMVKMLEDKGFTYKTSDGIYFDTAKFDRYADFARLDVEGLQEGHRVDSGEKRNKTDFALWKFSAPEDRRAMEWDSPWGRGFPGWHIECSAMSRHFLGDQFDIHTGGVDHIPIHHTNEIAQSECATGCSPFVNYWMHGEFLVVDDAPKMSKSLGNVLTVDTFVEKDINPLAYRLLCLQSHYRRQLKFSDENMVAAAKSYDRLLHHVRDLGNPNLAREECDLSDPKIAGLVKDFDEAIANDLNAPQALAIVFKLLEDKSLTKEQQLRLIGRFDQVLGLDLFREPMQASAAPPELLAKLDARNKARADKNWGEADRLRDEILAAGYEILDSPSGSSLKRKL